MRSNAVVLAAAMTLGVHVLLAQDESLPTFRTGVEAVMFDVRVTDAAGTPVTDLEAHEFQIFENGVPRAITAFSAMNHPVDEPLGPADGWRVQPDVRSNDDPEGRVFLFAVDETVDPDWALRTRFHLRRFLERHLQPNDLGAVALTGRGLATDGQDFTSDPRLLLSAIDKVSGGESFHHGFVRGPHFQIQDRLETFRVLVESLAAIPGGRKVMLYFTQDFRFDAYDAVDYRGGMPTLLGENGHNAISAATRGNVVIYPIDPRGLTLAGGASGTLSSLGAVTGGFAVVNSNSFDSGFERISRESSSYYVLGFNSSYDRRDGRFVDVDVRVTRPNLQVRARDGYIAPLAFGRDRTRPAPVPVPPGSPALGALEHPVAMRGVSLRVFAAAYKGTSRSANVALVVEADVATLGLVETDGVFKGELEVTYLATDARKRIHPGGRHSINLALEPERYEQVSRDWLRLVSQMALPEGRYQLRVGAGSGTRSGSVVYDLEVPDFSEPPLLLSGVSLTATAATRALTMRPPPAAGSAPRRCDPPGCTMPRLADGAPSPDDPLRDALPAPAIAVRDFSRDDIVTLYAEVYQNYSRRAPRLGVEFRTSLEDEQGVVTPMTREERGTLEGHESSDTHRFTAALPLKDVPSGRYVLHVEARSSAPDGQTVSRSLPIHVRED